MLVRCNANKKYWYPILIKQNPCWSHATDTVLTKNIIVQVSSVQLTGTVCKSRDFNTSSLISGFHSEVRIAAVACSTIEVSIIEIIERLCHYVFFIEKILEYVNILCSVYVLLIHSNRRQHDH